MCFILFPLEVPNWSPLPPECSDWEILLEEKGFLFTFPRVLPCLTSLPGEDVSTDPRLSNPVGLFPLLSLVALQHRYTHQPSLRSTVRSLVLPYPLTIKEQHKLSSGGARPVCRGKICLCSWKSVSMCMCVCVAVDHPLLGLTLNWSWPVKQLQKSTCLWCPTLRYQGGHAIPGRYIVGDGNSDSALRVLL